MRPVLCTAAARFSELLRWTGTLQLVNGTPKKMGVRLLLCVWMWGLSFEVGFRFFTHAFFSSHVSCFSGKTLEVIQFWGFTQETNERKKKKNEDEISRYLTIRSGRGRSFLVVIWCIWRSPFLFWSPFKPLRKKDLWGRRSETETKRNLW